ncbi:TasA family protein [Sporosarcina sp. NPDC096371]|uniref:TasA family protein n=1 Tax=Sporosarcina sp. NPDC096371 TaxID=3364530 RepID=UPI0037F6F89C
MNIKKQVGLGFMSAVLGVALIGGGTYAYFSDSEVSNNTFAAGTLDLALNPSEIINVDNLKPGDTITRTFELENNGTLDIDKVLLTTAVKVTDADGDNTEDFAEHIKVEMIYNADKLNEVVYETTLAELQAMTPDLVAENSDIPIFGSGLEAGDSDDLMVIFEFVDNKKDQNQFQGDSLQLEWTFTATQGEGEER